MKVILGNIEGYKANNSFKFGLGEFDPYKDPFAEYVWFDCGSASGSIKVITPNSNWDGYNTEFILSKVADVAINDTSIGPVRTATISQGDIIKVKFEQPHRIPACAFRGANVKNILHWPETGLPVELGYMYESSPRDKYLGSSFRDCGVASIVDAVDGFAYFMNDTFSNGNRAVTGTITMGPDCTFFGKQSFAGFGTSFNVIYKTNAIDDSVRRSDFGSYTWNNGSGFKFYIDDSVTYIPKYTFKNSLQVYIKNPTPPILSSAGNNSATIHVPTDLVSTYQAAWSRLTVVGDYND